MAETIDPFQHTILADTLRTITVETHIQTTFVYRDRERDTALTSLRFKRQRAHCRALR